MIKNKDSLKAKVNNLSKKINIQNQYIIQEFMFEALLRRISLSKYKNNFIIKGGLLLSSIFGVDLRSTMDLDTTIKGFALEKENLTRIINEIINIDANDNVKFTLVNIKDIRLEEEYSGYNVNLKADLDGLWTNLMIDVTTGDVITYKEIEYQYRTIFDDENISIMTYNYETIIAEKFEAIISRNIDNTRLKDYYDLYMFVKLKWNEVNFEKLKAALKNTSKHRGTENMMKKSTEYINLIAMDNNMKKLWNNYSKNYEYANCISFEDVIEALKVVNEIVIN